MECTIGVLGGMGTYATIFLFEKYAQIFPAQKEWERPRIIIDNRCTMPSRVRAYLYNENEETLIKQMTESLDLLIKAGCNKIILACNTSHIFLPEIVKELPTVGNVIENIILNCVEKVYDDQINEIFILGSEGTIDSNIYQVELQKLGIKWKVPSKDDYQKIRNCIEIVKQGKDMEEAGEWFLELLNRHNYCILGCTELPILYEYYKESVRCQKVYDPIEITLKKIKQDLSN